LRANAILEVSDLLTESRGSEVDSYVSPDVFGAIYTMYTQFSDFANYVDTMHIEQIRWPGGTLSETSPDKYSLEYLEIANPDLDRPGFSEMMRFCVENGKSLAMIIPTVQLHDSPEQLKKVVHDFAVRLVTGFYGELPRSLTLEIGNEYYAHSPFRESPELYGKAADLIIRELAAVLNDHRLNTTGSEISIAIQIGRGSEDDELIRAELSTISLAEIDQVRQHCISWSFGDADDRTNDFTTSRELWEEASLLAGGDGDLDTSLSAWSASSWTRGTALDSYENTYRRTFGTSIEVSEIEAINRSNVGFENYWQTGIMIGPNGELVDTGKGQDAFDYGVRSASHVLQILASYVDMGVDRAALYGVDVDGSIAGWKANGVAYEMVGGAMFSMMAESIAGTRMVGDPTRNFRPSGETEHINQYIFESDGKVVLFLSANDFSNRHGGLDVWLSLKGVVDEYAAVWGQSLTGEVPKNWKYLFGITDNPFVDETPESSKYAIATREDFAPKVRGEFLHLKFTKDYEVIRLVFAVNEEVVGPIATWAGSNYSAPQEPTAGIIVDGTEAADELSGATGDDTLSGAGGDDILHSSQGNDTIHGGEGNDTLVSLIDKPLHVDLGIDGFQRTGQGVDLIVGIENLYGGAAKDILKGNATDNSLVGGLGRDRLSGRSGDDSIIGGEGIDFIDGGLGRDTVLYFGGAAIEVSMSNRGPRHIGFASDHLRSIESIVSASGDDRLIGSSKANHMNSGGGDDLVSGRAGRDVFNGASGDDVLIGGKGFDTAVFFGGMDAIVDLSVAKRQDTGSGMDRLSGIECVYSGSGNDELSGNASGNGLYSGDGADLLSGRSGNDSLKGGDGDDTLWGGVGRDLLVGGSGLDQFVFGSRSGSDVVADFEVGIDRMAFTDGVANFAALRLMIVEGGVEILFTGGAITILGLTLSDISEADFDF